MKVILGSTEDVFCSLIAVVLRNKSREGRDEEGELILG